MDSALAMLLICALGSLWAPWVRASGDAPWLSRMGKFSSWNPVANIELPFSTYHPQGLVKIDSEYYLSTVDSDDKAGYLIHFTLDGPRLETSVARERKRIRIVDGPNGERYHPGGFDLDRKSGQLWLPLAEYRSHSTATILRIDPVSLRAEKRREFPDHLGTLMFDDANAALRLVNWDFGIYTLPLADTECVASNCDDPPVVIPQDQHDGYMYQDCKNAGNGYALCTGVKGWIWQEGVVDLIRFAPLGAAGDPYRLIKRIQVPRVDREQRPADWSLEPALSQNPVAYEILSDSEGSPFVRLYFVPHDGPNSRLFIYDVPLK